MENYCLLEPPGHTLNHNDRKTAIGLLCPWDLCAWCQPTGDEKYLKKIASLLNIYGGFFFFVSFPEQHTA